MSSACLFVSLNWLEDGKTKKSKSHSPSQLLNLFYYFTIYITSTRYLYIEQPPCDHILVCSRCKGYNIAVSPQNYWIMDASRKPNAGWRWKIFIVLDCGQKIQMFVMMTLIKHEEKVRKDRNHDKIWLFRETFYIHFNESPTMQI